MSSVYLTWIPVRRVNSSSVGWCFLSSLMSMYCVQLEKLTSFSWAEWSALDGPVPFSFVAAGMPQALRRGEAADGERADARGAQQGTAGQGAPAVGQAAPDGGQLGRAEGGAPRSTGIEGVREAGLVLLHTLYALSGGFGGLVGPLGYRSPKIVRCQSFAATAVLSYITCLTCVYSSKEYADMSFP